MSTVGTAQGPAVPDRAGIAAAAERFEANAIGALLQPIFDTVASGPFGGGSAEETWRPTMVAELAKHIAAGGGLGLAAPVMRQMLQMQEGVSQ